MAKRYTVTLTRDQLDDLTSTVELRVKSCEAYLQRKRLTPRLIEDTTALLNRNVLLLAALRDFKTTET